MSTCSIEGCGKPTRTRGYCNAHYLRYKKYGDPLCGGPSRPPRRSRINWLDRVALSHTSDDCLIFPFGNSAYPKVLTPGGQIAAHRYVCQKVHGPAPSPKHESAHSCGRGAEGCVSPQHVSWATRAENERDKVRHGTHNRGERNAQAKLTWAEVAEMRRLSGKLSQRKIGKMFGMSVAQTSKILRGESWRHQPTRSQSMPHGETIIQSLERSL